VIADPANAPERIEQRVRQRLRQLRTEQGLTLQQVAERASIDISTLSRLESGKRRLALDHIAPLAAALGVTTDELLADPAGEDPRVEGDPLSHDGMTLWLLTRRRRAGGITAYKVSISARRTTPPETFPVHEGEDWLYVLSGRLRLILGEQDLVIEPGEAVEFTTWTPHWFGAVDQPVEAILIVGPQGERAHLRR
jgi:transcriptional regulator with XRE-family HTH domain